MRGGFGHRMSNLYIIQASSDTDDAARDSTSQLMKKLCFVIAFLLVACTTREKRPPLDHSPAGGSAMGDDTKEPLSKPESIIAIDSGWQRFDSVYAHPSIRAAVEGDYVNAYLATDNFLNISKNVVDTNGRTAVICLTTGLGAYTGDGEVSFDYELEYVYLIALEQKGAKWILCDVLKIGESESRGTITRLVRVTPIPVRDGAEILVVNLQSSELSAGDYGKRLVTEEMMVLSNRTITGILQVTVEDLTFTSDEVSNYIEDLITSTYRMLEVEGGLLGDVEMITTRTRTGTEDGIDLNEKETDTVRFHFDGKAYTLVFE